MKQLLFIEHIQGAAVTNKKYLWVDEFCCKIVGRFDERRCCCSEGQVIGKFDTGAILSLPFYHFLWFMLLTPLNLAITDPWSNVW
jgi:hypothetical protein